MVPARCPKCRNAGVPVVWGKPGTPTLRADELGLVRAGGCIVRGTPNSTWWCPECIEPFEGTDTNAAIVAAVAAVAG